MYAQPERPLYEEQVAMDYGAVHSRMLKRTRRTGYLRQPGVKIGGDTPRFRCLRTPGTSKQSVREVYVPRHAESMPSDACTGEMASLEGIDGRLSFNRCEDGDEPDTETRRG